MLLIPMDEKIRVKIILGSTRQGRFGERPANWLYEELKKRSGVEVELLDLRDYRLPFFDEPVSPSMLNRKYSNLEVKRWSERIDDGDAFIIISPEYNHSFSGVLKNAIDSISPEWNNKAVGFLGYGTVGGARAVEQLRLVVIELRMVPIKKTIHVPFDMIMRAHQDKNVSDTELFAPLRSGMGQDNLEVFLNELLSMAKTLKAARQAAR